MWVISFSSLIINSKVSNKIFLKKCGQISVRYNWPLLIFDGHVTVAKYPLLPVPTSNEFNNGAFFYHYKTPPSIKTTLPPVSF